MYIEGVLIGPFAKLGKCKVSFPEESGLHLRECVGEFVDIFIE